MNRVDLRLVALAALLGACTPPLEELAPFPCANNNLCPAALTCVDKMCVKPTADASLATAEASTVDAGSSTKDSANSNEASTKPGIVVAMGKPRLEVNEGKSTDSFLVTLATAPKDVVAISVSSSNKDEATVSKGTLFFGATDWGTPQSVVVTGVDDSVADGDQTFTITLDPHESIDPEYAPLMSTSVSGVCVDDDGFDGGNTDAGDSSTAPVPGIIVSPSSGLTMSEGSFTTFTVALRAAPTASVTVTFESLSTKVTVSPPSIGFGPSNWNNVVQSVRVTTVDDNFVDGTVAWTIRTKVTPGADTRYNAIDPDDVSGTTTDDDIVERVSVSSSATEADGHSGGLAAGSQIDLGSPSMSSDGRYVVFASEATNLITPDSNNAADVFLVDRSTRTTTLISTAASKTAGGSVRPVISADGKYAAFYTQASIGSAQPGCLLMDITTRGFSQISANASCVVYDLSSDGRYAVFYDTVSADAAPPTYALKRYDRMGSVSTIQFLVSAPLSANITDDGRYLAVATTSALLTGDTNSVADLYLLDTMANNPLRFSSTSTGAQLTLGVTSGYISGDGNYLVFATRDAATAQDTDTDGDIYVVNRQTGSASVTLVSANSKAGFAGLSAGSRMSTDGRYGVFEFTPAGSTEKQAWTFDRLGSPSSLHKTFNSGTPNNATLYPTISGDGAWVAFVGLAANLVTVDSNNRNDVFVARRP